jgi:hypothetical protein
MGKEDLAIIVYDEVARVLQVKQRLIHNAAPHIKAGGQAVCAVNAARASEFRIDQKPDVFDQAEPWFDASHTLPYRECGPTSTPKTTR